MSVFTIRPTNSDKAIFRVHLTAVSLLSLKLRSGDLCTLSLATSRGGDDEKAALRQQGQNDSEKGHEEKKNSLTLATTKTAIAWESSGTGMKDSIVQTSKLLQELYGFKLGDRVTISRSSVRLQDAKRVVLRPKLSVSFSEDDQAKWSLFASSVIPVLYDVVAPSQKITIDIGHERNEFVVLDVGGPIARVTKETVFSFDSVENLKKSGALTVKIIAAMGGIQDQAQQIELFIRAFLDDRRQKAWSQYPRRHGLLLYGPKGTGKSRLLDLLTSATGWSGVVEWSPNSKAPTSTNGLHLVTIEFDDILDKEKVANEIQSLFKSLRNTATIVLGTVRHPNEIPGKLRKQDAFAVEVEMPVPTAPQRLEILKALKGDAMQPDDATLEELSRRTHGFVGADLHRLLTSMWDSAFARPQTVDEGPSTEVNTANKATDAPKILRSDVEGALALIRPSALEEIFLEKPNVRWTDIGGQHEIKRQLQNAIERPLKYPSEMKALGIRPKKGILLYGPPGCSKTLTVKALATEADLNFLAVKGAELISMYVGESERATREIFRKARQASPCIIFFDEIDAIASREGGGTGSSSLNVLTTLLNEMDGFEELRNVLVVAATNKPEIIDPALMRPGRFDRIVYVGPPDFDARKEILDKCFTTVSIHEDVRLQISDFALQTEGYSGAEVVEICQSAGENAFDAGRTSISVDDVVEAIQATPKGITQEMLSTYEKWNSARMR